VRVVKLAFVVVLAWTVCLTSMALASTPGGPVGQVAATYTPSIHWTGTTQQVRKMVQCGANMYAVGSFTQIDQGGVTTTRNGAFSFSATTGKLTAWNPNVNGTVNGVALSTDCSTAYLGGSFTTVGTSAAGNIAAVTTTTGAIKSTFAHSANAKVESLVMVGGRLIVGGYFTSVNGGTQKYLTSLNPNTGASDNYVTTSMAGTYVYTDQGGNHAQGGATSVYNMELSPNSAKLLVMGTFTSVAGQHRQQIFMLDLGSEVTLDNWYSAEFNAYCAVTEPFYLRAAAWSPDGATVYTAATGKKPASGPGYNVNDPRAGLCDAAAAFPSTSVSTQTHKWVNYNGCDSYYSIAADANDVYVGGHERWVNNSNGCNVAGPGALSRPGISALSPATGLGTDWNPTRDRGIGADDLMITTSPAGLWVSDDNANNNTLLCAKAKHPGLCFLPA